VTVEGVERLAPPPEGLDGRVLAGGGLSVAERMDVEASVPALKPRVREIVDVARVLLDEQGIDGLSMRAIASRLGVRAPSLYKHLADKQAIIDVLVADILRENGEATRAAIAGAEDPVAAILSTFRARSLGHPERYALCMSGPLADSPLVRSASLYAGDPLRWTMRDDLEGAVVFWAFSHGLVDLEIKGRIPPRYDAAELWAWGVARLRHPEDAAEAPAPRPATDAEALLRAGAPEPVALAPRVQRIVAVTRELLEEEGPEGMSMRRIAGRMGVRAPSLYKHVPDKRTLENAIIADVLREQGVLWHDVTAAAAAAGEDPLVAIMAAFREWALEHPALYRLNMRGPLDTGPLVRGAELESSLPVLRAAGGDPVAAITVWAFGHGMVDLELNHRLPPGYCLDSLRRRGIAALRPFDALPARP
jgi:AcrR family transcriptional regulator